MNKQLSKILLIVVSLGVVVGGYFLIKSNKSQVHEVVLGKNGFSPAVLTVAKGDKIVFKTTEGNDFWPASDPHPIHDKYAAFDPKERVSASSSWSFVAKKIGEWEYHDHLFPAFRGKIIVLSKKNWDIRSRVLTRDEISKMIDREGPDKVYKDLESIYDENLTNAHSTFHILGEVIYAKLGVSGISSCGDFGGFGCYHGLFIKAVSEKGIDAASELDQKCIEKYGELGLGCPHGIGHGLVEFFGYSKLSEALSICDKLTWKGPLFGCASGVFMEYNFRTTFKDDVATVSTREAHGSLYEPCRSLAANFRQDCYFEQASWWRVTLNSDYEKIGRFCNDLKGVEKDACLLGLGNSIAESSYYDKDVLQKACSLMPDKYTEAICRTGGSWAFFSNPDKRPQSESICTGLGTYEKLCLERRILVGEE